MEKKHTGIGIASFITATVTMVLVFMVIVIAGVVEVSTPGGLNEESPEAVIIGLVIIFLFVLLFVSFGLGIAGLFQKESKKVFPILGVVFSLITFWGTIALAVIGNSM